MESFYDKMPNLTERQSKLVADFWNGNSAELMSDAPTFQSAILTAVQFYIEKYREYNFKNVLTKYGIVKRGTKPALNAARIYNFKDDNQPDDPVFLKGPHNSNGKPLVPLKKTYEFEERWLPVNISFQIWQTLWDSNFFANVGDATTRLAVVGSITRNLYKKYDEYVYAMMANMIAYGYNESLLKDTQIIDVDLGNTSYLNVDGDGAIDFVTALDHVEWLAKETGYEQFNEEGFKEYWNDGDYVICVRPGFKNAIRKALMKNNYFSPEYVQSRIDRLVELPTVLTPCNYTVKTDATIPDPDHDGQTIADPNAGATLYPVYSGDNSATTYKGNGIVLGLSTVSGQTGAASVQYNFSSPSITYTETHPEVFAMIIDKERINWYSSVGGELSASLTVYDAFAHAQDLILSTFGVDNGETKIGASAFIDRTYPVVYFKNSNT